MLVLCLCFSYHCHKVYSRIELIDVNDWKILIQLRKCFMNIVNFLLTWMHDSLSKQRSEVKKGKHNVISSADSAQVTHLLSPNDVSNVLVIAMKCYLTIRKRCIKVYFRHASKGNIIFNQPHVHMQDHFVDGTNLGCAKDLIFIGTILKHNSSQSVHSVLSIDAKNDTFRVSNKLGNYTFAKAFSIFKISPYVKEVKIEHLPAELSTQYMNGEYVFSSISISIYDTD